MENCRRYVQLVQTILASCVRFNVVPRLLIEAQRSIELQATGVGPPLRLLPRPTAQSFCHSPSRERSRRPLSPPYPRPTLLSLCSFLCFHRSPLFLLRPSPARRSVRHLAPSVFRERGCTIRIPFPSNYNSSPFQSSSHAAFISRALPAKSNNFFSSPLPRRPTPLVTLDAPPRVGNCLPPVPVPRSSSSPAIFRRLRVPFDDECRPPGCLADRGLRYFFEKSGAARGRADGGTFITRPLMGTYRFEELIESRGTTALFWTIIVDSFLPEERQ